MMSKGLVLLYEAVCGSDHPEDENFTPTSRDGMDAGVASYLILEIIHKYIFYGYFFINFAV